MLGRTFASGGIHNSRIHWPSLGDSIQTVHCTCEGTTTCTACSRPGRRSITGIFWWVVRVEIGDTAD
jgi:hypothetical protein